jgi:ferritin-like metal-binding protein YciE
MADRVGERWDRAVEASLAQKDASDLGEEIVKYLRDAHSLEAQALQLLEAGPAIAEFPQLAQLFREHLNETREHQRLVDERLGELGGRPARFQAAALRIGGMNAGAFFKAQPDSPVKIAGFAYAFEAVEQGAYELLTRTAKRAGDERTWAIAEGILRNERDTAERVAATWDAAVDAALAQQVG